jgi:hypothetical protein
MQQRTESLQSCAILWFAIQFKTSASWISTKKPLNRWSLANIDWTEQTRIFFIMQAIFIKINRSKSDFSRLDFEICFTDLNEVIYFRISCSIVQNSSINYTMTIWRRASHTVVEQQRRDSLHVTNLSVNHLFDLKLMI